MPSKKAGHKRRKKHPSESLWSRFLWGRSSKTVDALHLLKNNFVSLTVPGPCTLSEVVKGIASCAATPVPIESLSDELNATKLGRGKVCFDCAGDLFNQIATNYPDMRWWISATGLNMEIVFPDPVLSPFDELAGKLTIDNWNGGLSKIALWTIASELDKAEFILRKELQAAQWKIIAAHNQKYSKKTIRNFQQAARDPRFVRSVRKRLYLARARFKKAYCRRE